MTKEQQKKYDEILMEVELTVKLPFTTVRFGGGWKDYAIETMDYGTILNLAWIQGRRAVLLERAIEKLITEKE